MSYLSNVVIRIHVIMPSQNTATSVTVKSLMAVSAGLFVARGQADLRFGMSMVRSLRFVHGIVDHIRPPVKVRCRRSIARYGTLYTSD